MSVAQGQLRSSNVNCSWNLGSRIPQQFMGVLEYYFGETNRDEVLRDFIARGAYDLYIEVEPGTTQLVGWSRIRPGTRIVMSAVFEQLLYIDEYRCPRPQCKAWNVSKETNKGWIDW